MHRQLVLAGFLVFAVRTIVIFSGMEPAKDRGPGLGLLDGTEDIVAIEVERGVASVARERASGGDRVHHGFIVF